MNFRVGGPESRLTASDVRAALTRLLKEWGEPSRIMAVPPDISRLYSHAGRATEVLYELAGDRLSDIIPALGTHRPMTDSEIDRMFGSVPHSLFRVHNWRTDLVTLGTVPGSFVSEVSEGTVDYSWPAQVNKRIVEGGHDLILSIGQVLPHEVIGMANHSKNIFVGTGGRDGINRSHFLGAAYGMERIMGRADNPVRAVLNRAWQEFAGDLPIVFFLTVVSSDPETGAPVLRGIFVGDGVECFYQAAELSRQVNLTLLDEKPEHVVAYLDPEEFRSTWLGNKAIYRTRMMIADGGRLTVLAPGVREFGEDEGIDRLIRRHGYRTTPEVMAAVEADPELAQDLSAAAHLIHGSSEGRFSVHYAPGHLTSEEIEGVGYSYESLTEMTARYDPEALKPGWNTLSDGERIYYVPNPAQGLWAHRDHFP